MSARRRRQAGFSLVELMVGVLMMSIVALALSGAFLVGYRTISTEARQISADEAVSSASLPMLRDFTSATTITTGTINPGSVPPLTITYGNPAITVTYRISAANILIRTVGATSTVAARGIRRVTVAVPNPNCYYTVTITPSAVGAVAVTLNLSRRTGPQGCY
jgi:prepilin-type N-terminal cleavage/methylation domain-containing protein